MLSLGMENALLFIFLEIIIIFQKTHFKKESRI